MQDQKRVFKPRTIKGAQVNICQENITLNQWHWSRTSVIYTHPCVALHVIVCWAISQHTMTSSNRNMFRVTGPLCREFTGDRWIPQHKGQWHGSLMFSLILAWINSWANSRDAGDLRRHRAHYDVTVMNIIKIKLQTLFPPFITCYSPLM